MICGVVAVNRRAKYRTNAPTLSVVPFLSLKSDFRKQGHYELMFARMFGVALAIRRRQNLQAALRIVYGRTCVYRSPSIPHKRSLLEHNTNAISFPCAVNRSI